MHLLRNGVKNYDWGSPDAIPQFLGDASGSGPVAEMWIGTHPLSPSMAIDDDGGERPLTEIAGDLPFMVKLLAADRPLSLQVHPSRPLAEAGFDREEAAGIPLPRGSGWHPARCAPTGLQGPQSQARDGLRAEHLRQLDRFPSDR